MYFASDNTGPVHPKVMDALLRANEGYATPYGADPIMDEVRARIRDLFEAPEAEVEPAIALIRNVMVEAPHPALTLKVPLLVDVRAALNWDEAH